MTFKSVFVAVFLGTALIVAALLVARQRPEVELAHPSADLVRAEGKCASCHRHETSTIVHEFERSNHARSGVNCLDCHQPQERQTGVSHNGFEIAESLTASNCRQCHSTEYEQFVRSRHAAPAWAAVMGAQGLTDQQIAAAERAHPGSVDRPPNALAVAEGRGVFKTGCMGCHAIGEPQADGTIGRCTECHSRHSASVALARQPETCGQCHMGPDHSQIEIFNESKHGVLYRARRAEMRLDAPPKELTTADMPVPTCATCHMSGLEGMNVTHDLTERLSWTLFAAVSEKRPGYARGQVAMQEVCTKCHARSSVERFYAEAEEVVLATNEKVKGSLAVVQALRDDGLLSPTPFDELVEFVAFDLWHYYGRTAKHGAFMGGADFVQWHGNYELLVKDVELREMAKEIRARAGRH